MPGSLAKASFILSEVACGVESHRRAGSRAYTSVGKLIAAIPKERLPPLSSDPQLNYFTIVVVRSALTEWQFLGFRVYCFVSHLTRQ